MNQINKLLLCLLFFSVACGEAPQKKPDKNEILKRGSELYAKYGCAVCHSLDGTVIYGPPLNEIYMKNVQVIRNGKEFTVIADREYLKKAITEPRYEKVLEYQNKEMPLTQISEEETEILVDYIIELDEKNKTGK
ncbi:MAG: c-type cytochrome [Draconibacterium sp.]|nr:c-type cytochrome [Draconibacterium sp.]